MGKDEVLCAVGGAMLPWRATETSLLEWGLNSKKKGFQPSLRKDRTICKGDKCKWQRQGDGTLGKTERRIGKH